MLICSKLIPEKNNRYCTIILEIVRYSDLFFNSVYKTSLFSSKKQNMLNNRFSDTNFQTFKDNIKKSLSTIPKEEQNKNTEFAEKIILYFIFLFFEYSKEIYSFKSDTNISFSQHPEIYTEIEKMLYSDFLKLLSKTDQNINANITSYIKTIDNITKCLSFYLTYGLDDEHNISGCVDDDLLLLTSKRSYLLKSEKFLQKECTNKAELKLNSARKSNLKSSKGLFNTIGKKYKHFRNRTKDLETHKSGIQQCTVTKDCAKLKNILFKFPQYRLLQYHYYLDGLYEDANEKTIQKIEEMKDTKCKNKS